MDGLSAGVAVERWTVATLLWPSMILQGRRLFAASGIRATRLRHIGPFLANVSESAITGVLTPPM